MVAIGRGLMSNPKILMLDEPSLGLAPKLVDEVLDTVRRLKRQGMTILLVEQNVREALDLADRGYVLQTGRIVGEGTGKELLASDRFRRLPRNLVPLRIWEIKTKTADWFLNHHVGTKLQRHIGTKKQRGKSPLALHFDYQVLEIAGADSRNT